MKKHHLSCVQYIQAAFKVCFFSVFLCVFSSVPVCFAAKKENQTASSLQQALEASYAANLAEQKQWLALLHFKKKSENSVSAVITSDFFLAPNGDHDALAEMHHTLAAFYSPAQDVPDFISPKCRFPARFRWLQKELLQRGIALPEKECPQFDSWLTSINPGRAVLAFPEAYLNNPASMFGHTLLRIDSENKEESPLTAPSIGYAALAGKERGFLYAFKGLTGGYVGRFLLDTYFAQARVYGDIENRDIWEYELNLTARELEMLLAHVYEIRHMDFAYYFIDENCSYQLLRLLEIVRPDLDLSSQFQRWTVPVDTVRAIREAGLISKVQYRSSRYSLMQRYEDALPAADVKLAVDIARGRVKVKSVANGILPPPDKARTLELASEKLLYDQVKKTGKENDNDPLFMEILSARSGLPTLDPLQVPVPQTPPDQGHDSACFLLGAGLRKEAPFASLALRPVLHDILDNPPGYVDGAAIEVLDTELRYYTREKSWELQRLTLLEIRSLPTRSHLSSPLSWEVSLGFDRYRFSGDDYDLVTEQLAGIGLTYNINNFLRLYGVTRAKVVENDNLEHGYEVGVGAVTGLLAHPCPQYRLQLQGEYTRWLIDAEESWAVSLQQAVFLDKNIALRITAALERDFYDPAFEVHCAVAIFF